MDEGLKYYLVEQQYKCFTSPRGYKISFRMGYCFFKSKHMARKVTVNAFSCFYNLK